jgi:uncharacterized protein (DUF433 family)
MKPQVGKIRHGDLVKTDRIKARDQSVWGMVIFVAATGKIRVMKHFERITVEPDKCGGGPRIRGLRIRVSDILGMLSEGVSREGIILRDFPCLEEEDVKATLAYATKQADHSILQAA